MQFEKYFVEIYVKIERNVNAYMCAQLHDCFQAGKVFCYDIH